MQDFPNVLSQSLFDFYKKIYSRLILLSYLIAIFQYFGPDMDPTVTELLHDFPDLTPHLYGVHANVVVGRNLAISVASKPQMMSFSTHSCTAWGRWAAWHTGTFHQNYVHSTIHFPLEHE